MVVSVPCVQTASDIDTDAGLLVDSNDLALVLIALAIRSGAMDITTLKMSIGGTDARTNGLGSLLLGQFHCHCVGLATEALSPNRRAGAGPLRLLGAQQIRD